MAHDNDETKRPAKRPKRTPKSKTNPKTNPFGPSFSALLDQMLGDILQGAERMRLINPRVAANKIGEGWVEFLLANDCTVIPSTPTTPPHIAQGPDQEPVPFMGIGGALENPQTGEELPFMLLGIYDQECIEKTKQMLLEIYQSRYERGRDTPARPRPAPSKDPFFTNLESQMKDFMKGDKS